MNRYVFLALGLLAGVAFSTEWRPIFHSAGGGQWDLRRGSTSTRTVEGRASVTAYVRVTDDKGVETVFMGAVPAEHCGARRGDVQLLTIQGVPLMRSVFTVGDGSNGAALARALCKANGRNEEPAP